MSNMRRDAKEEIIKLEKMMVKIDDFLCHAPEGCLKWQNRRKKTYYYQQYMEKEDKNGSSRKWNRKYISNGNVSIAKDLAKKHYYIALKSVIQKRLMALRKFIRNYPVAEIETIYDEMCDERKVLIEPIEITAKERVKQWNEEVYEKNTSYPENLRYQTEQGDIVRSKSEVIIANILYQHRKKILYKYERPLRVIVDGKEKTIYPDFSIINLRTGKVIYWEHAGRMSDSYYANEFVKKINTYIANDLLPGQDVLVTFETQENPLDIRVVKQLVKGVI